jgi:hypothetical protein
MRITSVVFLMLSVCVTTGNSQDLAHQIDAAQRLNWYVRILSVDSTSVSGRIRRADSESIVIGSDKFRIDDVAALERRLSVGGGWKLGAVFGAMTGAGFGASPVCVTRIAMGSHSKAL